jgi:hypothetical protein
VREQEQCGENRVADEKIIHAKNRIKTGFSGSRTNGFTPSLCEAVVEVLSQNPIKEKI